MEHLRGEQRIDHFWKDIAVCDGLVQPIVIHLGRTRILPS